MEACSQRLKSESRTKQSPVHPISNDADRETEEMIDEEDIDYDFASKTTMHGIQRLVERRHRSYKVFWIIVITAAVVFCGWEVAKRISVYLEYNVNTEISVEYLKNMTFPAVTICNFNRYQRSKITKNDNEYIECAVILSPELGGYDVGRITETDKQECTHWLTTTSFNTTEFTVRTGFDLDVVTLLTCKFRGIDCYSKNFTSVITNYGRCWTFNGFSDTAIKQLQPGFGNGLHLVINVNQKEYSESLELDYIGMDAGLRVLVHPQDTTPNVYSRGFAIGTGMHAYADVAVTEYENQEEPWGKCKEGQKLDYYNTYSYDSCIMECEMKYYVQVCSCKPERYHGPYRICEPSEYDCVANVINEISKSKLECDCKIDCNDITYDTSLSYANIPSYSIANETVEVFNLTAEYMRDNVVVLDVYYSELSKQVYKQTKAMTSSALLSDIGGQLGLFIGMSFITIIEITEYLTAKLKRFCTESERGHRKKKNSDDTRDNNIKMAEENRGYVSKM